MDPLHDDICHGCPLYIWCLAHGPLPDNEFLLMLCESCQGLYVTVEFTSSYDEFTPDRRPKNFLVKSKPMCLDTSLKPHKIYEGSRCDQCQHAQHMRYFEARVFTGLGVHAQLEKKS
jgi:hypothetical protein